MRDDKHSTERKVVRPLRRVQSFSYVIVGTPRILGGRLIILEAVEGMWPDSQVDGQASGWRDLWLR